MALRHAVLLLRREGFWAAELGHAVSPAVHLLRAMTRHDDV